MSIIIDIVIIAVILFCLYRGYKQGLIGLAFSIVSFIAALIIAFPPIVPPPTPMLLNDSAVKSNPMLESLNIKFSSE